MKYIIGGAILVIIVAGFIAGIIGLASRDTPSETIVESSFASSYLDQNSEVSFTEYGRIVANEEFEAVRVTVTAQERTLDVLRGYDLTIEERVQLPNITSAYKALLYSLDSYNATETQESTIEAEDGVCPSGRRFVFEIKVDDEVVHRTWTSSCRRSDGTFAGDRSSVEALFQEQIPEYRDIVRDARR
jgi:hypothetical protein